MSTFDFSGLATSGSWSDANFSQDTTNFTVFSLAAQTANGSLSALRGALSGTGASRAKLIGKTWASTLAGKVTIKGVASFTVADDAVYVGLVVETGVDSWKGYWWQVQNGFQRLWRQDSATAAPNAGSAMAGSTAASIAEGDTFELSLNTSTGAITAKQNGSTISTVTDTTYASGLTPAFYVADNNHAGTGISLLETTGDSSGGGSPTPQRIQYQTKTLYFI